jgi:E3 ubiquitin-protein ligase RNF115/126
LTALAAYQGIRDAMADHSSRPGGGSRHLDASGPREVVYCHQCDHEWYQDESGLVCPNCEGEITEIVRYSGTSVELEDILTASQITAESDPRPGGPTLANDDPPTPPGFQSLHSLRHHNPWGAEEYPDPGEADIEEHITQGPGGSVLFSRTVRTSNAPRGFGSSRRRRDPMPQDDPDFVMRDFQNMIGNLMGPGFRPGQPGRSGPDTLFTQYPNGTGFRIGGSNGGPQVMGGRFTFTTTGGRLRPRDANGPQPGGPPIDDLATYASPPTPDSSNGRPLFIISIRAPPNEIASIIGGLLGSMAAPPGHHADGPGMPPTFQALFASMLNPANARAGDAVYSQEALDQIISTLMEQHPTSNAPGPASPDAIAALPKKNLDEKLLGPEGKGECSVCMDDVHIGDEVVLLPCNHWFHETCAGAWLSEHNTCPICRKGIDGDSATSSSRRSSQSTPSSRNDHRARRLSSARMSIRRTDTSESARNQARLDAIRGLGRVTPPAEGAPGEPRRWPSNGDARGPREADDYATRMPGSFRRQSEVSETHRRGNTSDSDRSRESDRERRRSSHSGSGSGGGGGGGPMSWLRDRLGGSRRRND